jgi:hypothetical protein
VPLKVGFYKLFEICGDPEATVGEMWEDGEWNVQFRRGLDGDQRVEWHSLMDKLRGVVLNNEDRVTWALEKSGQFTTKSLYRQVSFGGIISRRMREIWGTKVLLKVRIFMWQMFHGKLQSAEQLKKKIWKGDIHCVMCGKEEDLNHIMFRCACNRFVWVAVKEALGWQKTPTSLEDFITNWLDSGRVRNKKLMLFGLGAICWVIWKVRNKMAIERKVVKTPQEVLYSAIFFMQSWKILLSNEEQEMVWGVTERFRWKLDRIIEAAQRKGVG